MNPLTNSIKKFKARHSPHRRDVSPEDSDKVVLACAETGPLTTRFKSSSTARIDKEIRSMYLMNHLDEQGFYM